MRKYFGTDGVRGEANRELTADLAMRLGYALGFYLRKENPDKKILKVIMTLVLICSCFYLAISLFMNHLIINDMVPTVVKSTAV